LSEENNNDEPILSVTATPIKGDPLTMKFPLSEDSVIVSRSTVPAVSSDESGLIVHYVAQLLDAVKEKYQPDKHKLVVKFSEKEEIDKGWFSHFDLDLGLNLDAGKWEAKVEGTPRKIKRTKEKTVEVSLKDKQEDS